MTTFTSFDAGKKMETVLAQAEADGEVRITRKDGKVFTVRPTGRSPLDVGSIKLKQPLGIDEIVSLIHEGRDRDYGIK